jgi:hypothetical protein
MLKLPHYKNGELLHNAFPTEHTTFKFIEGNSKQEDYTHSDVWNDPNRIWLLIYPIFKFIVMLATHRPFGNGCCSIIYTL